MIEIFKPRLSRFKILLYIFELTYIVFYCDKNNLNLRLYGTSVNVNGD